MPCDYRSCDDHVTTGHGSAAVEQHREASDGGDL